MAQGGNRPVITKRLQELPEQTRNRIGIGLIALIAIAIYIAVTIRIPEGPDWHATYRAGALAVITGQSPYVVVEYFFAPPWAVLPLIPLAILPEVIGRGLFFVLSIGMIGYTCYRLGGGPVTMLAILLSAPVANCLYAGNIDPMVMLGVILPPQIGLIFLSMKPQSTMMVILFLVIEAWRDGGIKRVLQISWPTALVVVLSFVIYGPWILRAQDIYSPAGIYNISLWPQGLVIGSVLMVIALRDRRKHLSMIASPFFSPYTLLLSWTGAMLGLSKTTVEAIVASVMTWVFWIIYHGSFVL
jgi:hypothetical protein